MDNREFKFRVWSPKNKQMYFSSSRPFNEWWDKKDKHNWGYVKCNYSVDMLGRLSHCDILENNYTDYVTQFTGLKDKNNKEIYEGDIVKTDPNHFMAILKAVRESKEYTEYSNGVVEWWNEGFAVCQKVIGATRISEYASCHCCPCGLEIIGNIFETPELLK